MIDPNFAANQQKNLEAECAKLRSELERVEDRVDEEWLDAIGTCFQRITGQSWETRDGETREEGLGANIGALFQWAEDRLDAAKARAEKATRENDLLRGLLPKLNAPCPYCGTADISKCERGFPGCSYADDLMVAEDETFRRVVAENQQLRALAKQKGAGCEKEDEGAGSL